MPIKYIPYYPNTVEGQAVLDKLIKNGIRRIINGTL